MEYSMTLSGREFIITLATYLKVSRLQEQTFDN